MDAPADDPREESIGDLFGRLVDDGKAYARAELDLYKEIAAHRAGRARSGFVACVIGGVLIFCAVLALLLGSVLALAQLIGPLLAGLAIFALLGLVGFLLIRSGAAGLAALKGGEDEAEALKRGETP